MLALLALTPAALAQDVLLIWDDQGIGTPDLVAALQGAGMTVTLSDTVEYEYDGTNPAPDGFNAVIHMNGTTYGTPMTAAGAAALVDYVADGGGYIHFEWDAYEIDDNGVQLELEPITLLHRDSGFTGDITLSPVRGQESHPVLAGIPSSVAFYAGGNIGYVRSFSDQPAVAIMTDQSGSDAVAVREWEQGRIVGFHHAGNYSDLSTFSNADVSRLVVNAVNWVAVCDADGDGYERAGGTCAATDCDDQDPDIFPGADEVCDTLDNNCDGDIDGPDSVDAVVYYYDDDGDGFGDREHSLASCDPLSGAVLDDSDCDDGDADVHPGAAEVPWDGIDQDCDGADLCDVDGDGEDASDCGGPDCDDEDAAVNTSAEEVWYDGVDQNCDGQADDDADGDGYASEDYNGEDCDDTDPDINPDAIDDDGDGVDDDCNGFVDEDVPEDKVCGTVEPAGGVGGGVLALLVLGVLRRRRG
ncbi:MAG: putative metal-binding motif-containing protein [Alphaproteobacteria bacterium]|nr:putative metal-binding motif-containing protein [Alphaproteobacteria bacterium]